MDQQAFELLKVMIEEMRADIKILMAFRWQVTGVVIVFNIIFGVIAQIAIAYMSRG